MAICVAVISVVPINLGQQSVVPTLPIPIQVSVSLR